MYFLLRNGEKDKKCIIPHFSSAASLHCAGGECAGLSGPIDMWRTWFYAKNMGAMVQIRNVPEALHRQLKSRAALAGMSLSDYLLSEIRQVAERPTIDELRARLRGRTETAPSVPPAEAVRAERDRA